jgi:cobalt-zinc-cadmium resistance protein CzcA
MIGKLIDFILRERLIVIGLSMILLVGGIYAFKHLDIEAYPDPSPPTVEVIAQNSGWSAEEMERQITVPLETQLNGMPGLDHIRSISLFGLTDIKCYFTFESDYWAARQEVINRIQMVPLPQGVQPELSPWSAIGEIYRYQLVGESYSLMDIKTAQDWILERQFKQIPGVVDVVSFGGPTKEFHVNLDPNKLIAFGLSVPQVMSALSNSNSNVGANYLELGVQSYNVRGIGLFKGLDDIGDVVVSAKSGTPVYIKQLGSVELGHKVLMGRVGKNAQSDIVQGIVLMRRGEKSLPTLERVREKVRLLNDGILPRGMRIVPYYDRTDLINVTTDTVTHTLVFGMVLVGIILLAFLGDLRASLVVALTIPLSLFFTFIVMVLRGDSANLISMGAIDFGIIVSASVVMVENIYRFLSEPNPYRYNVRRTIVLAASGVAKPIFFSTAIIVAAFIPLFTMQGVEGKVFGPMALTYGFALTGALLLALTFSPVMSSLVLKPSERERETVLVHALKKLYSRLLPAVMRHPALTLGANALALILSVAALPFIGGEFMPKLEEGNLWARTVMPNTISFSYANELVDQIRIKFKSYPEVADVVSQLGRPDDGTDPVSYFSCDYFINLKPRDQWPKGTTKLELVSQMEADLSQYPGLETNFSQNIEDNVAEAMSGVKGENSIKLFGEDLQTLGKKAVQIEDVMKTVPGVSDLGIYQMLGQPNLLIRVNRQEAARYGILPADINGIVQAAIGGQAVTQVLDEDRRFDVVVRFLPQYRENPEAIANIPVSTPDGGHIPLKMVADVSRETGAAFIYREDNSRYLPIKFSIRGRDLQSTISEADAKIRRLVPLPPGYHFTWAGQFQSLQEAVTRLEIVVPISLFLIFVLLYSHFRSMVDALLVIGAVLPVMIGGIVALLLTKTNFSISAAVGFISLFGVAVLDGVILVTSINTLRHQGVQLREAVTRGAQQLLRPVLMTAFAAAFGLLPASIATGIGSETQRPLARVVVGGMMAAPIFILLVLPVLYAQVHRKSVPHAATPAEDEGTGNITGG